MTENVDARELVTASCVRGRCVDGTRINIVLQKSYDNKIAWKWDLKERSRRAQAQCIAAITEVISEAGNEEYPCEIRIKAGGDELLGIARGTGEPSPIGSVETDGIDGQDTAITRRSWGDHAL